MRTILPFDKYMKLTKYDDQSAEFYKSLTQKDTF